MKFLDQVKIFVKAGDGGSGSASMRREKFIEFGGPDGGNGGKGASIILKAERNLNTLIDYRYTQHFKAERGENGKGKNKTGKTGKDLILKVPVGTQILEEDNKTLLFDFKNEEEEFVVAIGGRGGKDLYLKVPIGTQILEEDNKTLLFDFKNKKEEFVVANGGKGGLGNTNFKSSTNRAPRKFTKGTFGEEFWIWLQLKTIADVGIIGLPNAGKSSLLAAVTNANPKIASYKFTTLNPNLGVATYDNKEITIADIPGLVEGAHTGIGLGIKFLKHIERCKTLLHMIDITEKNLENSYKKIKKELASYSKELLNKKEIIVLNKIDLLEKETVNKIIKNFSKNKKCEVITLSTFKKNSISKIKSKLLSYVS